MARRSGDKAIPAFEVDAESSLPIWIQLKDRFAYLIASGYYKPEDQLPSVRSVAAKMLISYNTVSKAYMALEREGYIATKHGSGAYVRSVDSDAVVSELEVITEDYIKTCLEKGMTFEDIPRYINRAIRNMRKEHDGKQRP